jgi:hypothetical protein
MFDFLFVSFLIVMTGYTAFTAYLECLQEYSGVWRPLMQKDYVAATMIIRILGVTGSPNNLFFITIPAWLVLYAIAYFGELKGSMDYLNAVLVSGLSGLFFLTARRNFIILRNKKSR